MIFLFPSTPVGGIRTGIVPNDTAYPWGGMALPRVALTVPSLIVQAGMPQTTAHELAHTSGQLHVNCGGPAGPFGGLPLTISDPGRVEGEPSSEGELTVEAVARGRALAATKVPLETPCGYPPARPAEHPPRTAVGLVSFPERADTLRVIHEGKTLLERSAPAVAAIRRCSGRTRSTARRSR